MKHYQNTADYIERALLGRPEGFSVWLTADQCRLIYTLLSHAVQDSDDETLRKLYERFGTQWKAKLNTTSNLR